MSAPATARMGEAAFQELLKYWGDLNIGFDAVAAECARARGREEAMEKALRKIAHPESAKDGYLENCPGCIARAALETP